MPSYAESQLRFMVTQLTPILTQLGDLVIPDRERVAGYTPELRLFWRRNLDSFLTFVRGQAVVPEMSVVRTRDTSLRAITEVRGADWRRPHSQWAVINAAPLNRAFLEVLPPPPPAAPRCPNTRGARGRTQPPPPAEPSQPPPPAEPLQAGRPKLTRLVHGLLMLNYYNTQFLRLLGLTVFVLFSFSQQRDRDASTFMAFEPEVATAAEAAEGAEGGAEVEAGAEADVPDSRPKCRRLDSKFHFSELLTLSSPGFPRFLIFVDIS